MQKIGYFSKYYDNGIAIEQAPQAQRGKGLIWDVAKYLTRIRVDVHTKRLAQ